MSRSYAVVTSRAVRSEGNADRTIRLPRRATTNGYKAGTETELASPLIRHPVIATRVPREDSLARRTCGRFVSTPRHATRQKQADCGSRSVPSRTPSAPGAKHLRHGTTHTHIRKPGISLALPDKPRPTRQCIYTLQSTPGGQGYVSCWGREDSVPL